MRSTRIDAVVFLPSLPPEVNLTQGRDPESSDRARITCVPTIDGRILCLVETFAWTSPVALTELINDHPKARVGMVPGARIPIGRGREITNLPTAEAFLHWTGLPVDFETHQALVEFFAQPRRNGPPIPRQRLEKRPPSESETCVVCLERWGPTRQRVIFRCGHGRTCTVCTRRLWATGKCPECRSPMSPVRVLHCVVCGEAAPQALLQPCGHALLCLDCGSQDVNQLKECALCGQRVRDVQTGRVFL